MVWGMFVVYWLPDSPIKAKCWSEEDKHLIAERVRKNQTGIQNKEFKVRHLNISREVSNLIFALAPLDAPSARGSHGPNSLGGDHHLFYERIPHWRNRCLRKYHRQRVWLYSFADLSSRDCSGRNHRVIFVLCCVPCEDMEAEAECRFRKFFEYPLQENGLLILLPLSYIPCQISLALSPSLVSAPLCARPSKLTFAKP